MQQSLLGNGIPDALSVKVRSLHWLNEKKVIDFDYTAERWAFNVDLLEKRGAI